MGTPERLRGVGVGAGWFSRFHYDAWSKIAAVDMVAVCDLEPQNAEHASATLGGAAVYTEASKMLRETRPDFVDVITRPESHLSIVRSAAELGIHVICQKPLAPSFEQAREIVALAEAAGIRLMVHENFRFQPWHRELKSLIAAGAIGDDLHMVAVRTRLGDGWQPDAYQSRQPYFATMPRLLVYETGVHFIDVMRYFAGEIDGVFASLRRLNHQIAGEDTGLLFFEFASGARGTWDASRYHEPDCENPRYTFGEFLIEGSQGSLRLDYDGRIRIQPLGEPSRKHAYAHSHAGFAGDCVYFTQQHFVEALLNGKPFETGGTDYLKTLAVQEAVYRSASSGQPVRGLTAGADHADR
ncbi:putative oxidoreductase YcjS [Maioricimonas rarisocia]|uniref:Putative oxidoreductase YcjS n=1 Tax=Maioricimonas rarisocia TaxID=2528026 RepID=A0A517ZAL4_9PLAN|nr:Gfo/Idh/MocA family oxidoreductase [Maioricimonas rarisocia]QDU39543.1 putative oxidoreductase YcjS [Maioricimonas rarisocia]